MASSRRVTKQTGARLGTHNKYFNGKIPTNKACLSVSGTCRRRAKDFCTEGSGKFLPIMAMGLLRAFDVPAVASIWMLLGIYARPRDAQSYR